MSNTERLEETKKRLEKNWSCLNKKLENVQRERILETRAEEKVRLDKEISDMQSDMREIEVSLEKVEAKLDGVSPKNHFALTKGDEKYPAMQSTEIFFYKKGICLNQQFEKYLVDTEITFQHRYKDNILLTDIYVYPHLKDLQEDIGKFKNIVDSKKFFELDKLIGNYIIFAEEQLGKTSLSKMLFLNYFHLEALPLILRGSEIDKSIPDKLLERNIKNQYQSLSFEIFLNTDVKKIVIIDDFDLIKLNSKYQKQFIEDLGKYFQHIILLSDNEFKYVVPDIDYLTSFRKLEILPFGNVNRGELINLWNSLGRKETINSRELHKLNDEFTVHINAIIRRNLIPLKPFFILTVLQSLESMRPADYSLTSYGHCYQYLIMRSLENVKIAPQEIDTYMNYLTELAFFIFGREKSDISLKDFENKFAKARV